MPADSRAASLAHVCRTVERRAERALVALGNEEALKDTPRQYLNRYNPNGSVGDDMYWKSEHLAQSAAE